MEGDLTYLYHVYKYGVQGTANLMNCHPSVVTRRLQNSETDMGCPLFERHPGGRMVPLPMMHRLYAVIAPTVEGLAAMKPLARKRNNGVVMKVGASEFMIREYLVPIIGQIQREYPSLCIKTCLGHRDQIESWLENKEIDLGVIATAEPPRKWQWREFVQVPPVLLTLEGTCFPGLDAMLAEEPVRHRLVRPPECEGVCQLFLPFLQQRGKFMPLGTEAGSTALVPALLSAPDMVGLSVGVKALELPGIVRHPLPLPNLHVGAMWRGQTTPLLKGIMDLIAHTAPQYQAILHAAEEPPRVRIKNGTNVRAAAQTAAAKPAILPAPGDEIAKTTIASNRAKSTRRIVKTL